MAKTRTPTPKIENSVPLRSIFPMGNYKLRSQNILEKGFPIFVPLGASGGIPTLDIVIVSQMFLPQRFLKKLIR
jgi:hypothetical protein